MPDQSYTLPEDWEKYEMQKEIENEKKRIALENFHEQHPGFENNAWVDPDVENFFHFEGFLAGQARVKRLIDNQWGWLSHIDMDGCAVRIYFNFREVDRYE